MNVKIVGRSMDGLRTMQVVGARKITPGRDDGLRIVLPHSQGTVEILERVESDADGASRILDVDVRDETGRLLHGDSWIVDTFDIARCRVGPGAVAAGTKGRGILDAIARLGGEARFGAILARIDSWTGNPNARQRQQRVQMLLHHVSKGGYVERPKVRGGTYRLTQEGWAIVGNLPQAKDSNDGAAPVRGVHVEGGSRKFT